MPVRKSNINTILFELTLCQFVIQTSVYIYMYKYILIHSQAAYDARFHIHIRFDENVNANLCSYILTYIQTKVHLHTQAMGLSFYHVTPIYISLGC